MMQDDHTRDLDATVRVSAGAELEETADGPAGHGERVARSCLQNLNVFVRGHPESNGDQLAPFIGFGIAYGPDLDDRALEVLRPLDRRDSGNEFAARGGEFQAGQAPFGCD